MEASRAADPALQAIQQQFGESMQEVWQGLNQLRAELAERRGGSMDVAPGESLASVNRLAEGPRRLAVKAERQVMAVRVSQLAASVT